GRLSWKKGLDRLLEAAAEVPEAHVWIAGNDEDSTVPRLEKQAAGLGISQRIRFLGFVEGIEKRRLLARASVFVLPSQSENFGNAVLEAMAEGCPVVVSPTVGLAPT